MTELRGGFNSPRSSHGGTEKRRTAFKNPKQNKSPLLRFSVLYDVDLRSPPRPSLPPTRDADSGGCHEPPPRADDEVGIANLDPDRVPAAILDAGRGVPEVVLLAQLVGDAGGRRIEI